MITLQDSHAVDQRKCAPSQASGLSLPHQPGGPIFQEAQKLGEPIRFGRAVNPQAGCCVNKLKTGTTEGCCSHISTAQHLARFREAVQAEQERTGAHPKLDAHTQAILDGKVKPGDPFPLTDTGSSAALTGTRPNPNANETARHQESFIVRAMLAPFRFIKWLFIGFAKDMKQLFTGKEVP